MKEELKTRITQALKDFPDFEIIDVQDEVWFQTQKNSGKSIFALHWKTKSTLHLHIAKPGCFGMACETIEKEEFLEFMSKELSEEKMNILKQVLQIIYKITSFD